MFIASAPLLAKAKRQKRKLICLINETSVVTHYTSFLSYSQFRKDDLSQELYSSMNLRSVRNQV